VDPKESDALKPNIIVTTQSGHTL